MKKADLVLIGKVQRSQGNRGQVKLRLLERELPEFSCTDVYLAKAGELEAFTAESLEIDRHSVFLKLKGIDTLAQADALVGREVMVPENSFPALPDGRYYDFQLIGCRVVTGTGMDVGTVEGLMPAGDETVLIVKRRERELFIPLTETICRRIDPEKKEIVIEPPDGLLELNEI